LKQAHAFNGVLFDIDGTIENTSEFINAAFEHVFSTIGHPGVSRQEINSSIGLPLKEIYDRFAPEYTFETLRDLHNKFQMSNLSLIIPYDGVLELLTTISNAKIPIAAVSSRKREVIEATLAYSNLKRYFSIIVGPYDTPHHKPHPAPLLYALEHISVSPEHAIMIGDSYIDIQAGKNAGTKTMRVTYGFNTERLHDPVPDFIVHRPIDILKHIL
jgi:pyrophosphatase PpaX